MFYVLFDMKRVVNLIICLNKFTESVLSVVMQLFVRMMKLHGNVSTIAALVE